jgi:hypothetical protein
MVRDPLTVPDVEKEEDVEEEPAEEPPYRVLVHKWNVTFAI